MTKFFWLNIFLFLNVQIFAQTAPPDGLAGSDLRTWYKQNWYDGKHRSLGYDGAREQMYGAIDIDNGKVTCVYSGFEDDGGFITFPDPINAEHTVPQSFFGGESQPVPRSDIHHLFPTHGTANSARSNFPFAELTPSQTDRWYYVSSGNSFQSSTSQPSNPDVAGKLNSGTSFEPPEAHKGNVARAVFYFYTMYPQYMSTMSNIGNLNTLYQWHLDDPVDATERERNDAIENAQGNRNPYIDFPETLAYAWDFATQPRTVFFNPVSELVLEPEMGTTSHIFNVEITSAPSSTVSVEVTLDNTGTTAQSSDYSFTSTTLSFDASTTSQQVMLTVNSDDDTEMNENVRFKLQNISGDAEISLNNDEYTAIITESLTPLESISASSFFNIAPNPTDNELFIENKTNKPYFLKIYDLSGKLWLKYQVKEEKMQIDLRGIPTGMYLFKVEVGKMKFVERVWVRH